MPIYEYACNSCGHELETLQKLSEPPLTDCPECGKAELRKKVSAAGFRLKGSGWYETDFKKDKKKNLAGESKDGDSKGAEKKSEGSSNGPGSEGKSKSDKPKSDSGKSSSSAKSD